jgi:hypothetical protein
LPLAALRGDPVKPGTVMPRRRVPCLDCGTLILRAPHFATARCQRCMRRHGSRGYAMRVKDIRDQARRFRIVCHVLGWEPEQFAEMLEEMRRSPMAFRHAPETRAARFDLRNERRRCA